MRKRTSKGNSRPSKSSSSKPLALFKTKWLSRSRERNNSKHHKRLAPTDSIREPVETGVKETL